MPLMRPQNTTVSKPLSAFTTDSEVSTAAFSATDSVWPHAGATMSSAELSDATSIVFRSVLRRAASSVTLPTMVTCGIEFRIQHL